MILRITFACAVVMACAPTAPRAAGGDRPNVATDTTRVTVRIKGLRSGDGHVFVALFTDREGFPNQHRKAFSGKRVKSRRGRAVAVFPGVPRGEFAVAVFHDENDNKKMDTNFLGAPVEGYGASRNPKPRMGPPRWKDCVLRTGAEPRVGVPIRMKYL